MSTIDVRRKNAAGTARTRAFRTGGGWTQLAFAVAFNCLISPAGAQQLVKEILPVAPRSGTLEARLATVTLPPGFIGHWHTYPNHPVVYVAEGAITVEFRNGGTKVYRAGEGFVEPVDTVLRGLNTGGAPVKLVVFRLSPPEVPDAVDAPAP
ncbi:MAG TPA: cupin domain-containing protein [Microvirga sp.]|jgi:quercetin dioxygenase-like cupin family protein|nr:cupin domain-containing protein [Microvirga sp.]